MRILILSQWFDPEQASKGLPFAKELQRRGHDVSVLTGFPNYAGGKVYEGYRVRPVARETTEGIDVLRVALYPSHDGSGLRRVANYVSLAASASVAAFSVKRPDVVYVYHPPATIGLPALVLKWLRGVPFVFDVQDAPPENGRASNTTCPMPIRRHTARWLRTVCRSSARVVAPSEAVKSSVAQQGVPLGKIEVLADRECDAPPDGRSPDAPDGCASRFDRLLETSALARPWQDAAKRALDLTLSSTILVVASPVLALESIAIRRTMKGPALFRQTRPGRFAQPFEIIKFRTMSEARDDLGRLLPDNERLTTLGAFLRRSSLDELPELWNVVRGDMSLVGPRPLLEQYTAYFTDEERLRLEVLPGITGWAQVNGRNTATWDARLRMDVWYVRNRSLLLDTGVLARTAWNALRGSGVVVDPTSVMRDLNDERQERLGLR